MGHMIVWKTGTCLECFAPQIVLTFLQWCIKMGHKDESVREWVAQSRRIKATQRGTPADGTQLFCKVIIH